MNCQPLAKLEGGSTYYYHNDHLGTPQKMTDSSGIVVWAADYKPYGETISITATGNFTNNLRFPGQYYDVETGLHYNYFRDYDPVIGRYIEADPIGLEDGENHLFAYSGNNPIMFDDPEGLQCQPSCYFSTCYTKCFSKFHGNQALMVTPLFVFATVPSPLAK